VSQRRSSKPLAKPSSPWVKVAAVAVVVVLAFAAVIALLAGGGGDSNTTKPTSGSPSTAAGTAASAAGKPCVAVSQPLPAGAPAVPVTVGPPPTQLVTKDLQVGTGATVNPGATVTVDYVGVSCSTGKVFDSSYSSGQSVPLSLSQVIPGWQQGIPGMKVGGLRLLGIPPDLAYGSQGRPPVIAPDETLWFVVKVESAG
jgi:peptidylprolyl isomerase